MRLLVAGASVLLLGVGRVGATDNFFELGGHSLLATQVISRLAQAFGVELPLRRLFESPTVGELAEAEGHHPALLTEWGKVTVTWYTHKIRGLHRNDFIMAAKTDALAGEQGTEGNRA